MVRPELEQVTFVSRSRMEQTTNMPFWYLYYLCYYGFWVRGRVFINLISKSFCFEVTFFTSLKSFSFNFSRHPLNMMLVRLSIAGHPPAIWSGCPNSSPAPIWVEIDTVSQSKVPSTRMQFEPESLGQESNKLKASRLTRNIFPFIGIFLLKLLELSLRPPDVIAGYLPVFCQVALIVRHLPLYTWVETGAVRVKCLSQNTT